MSIDPVALLKTFVSIPSLSGEEGPLADVVERTVAEAGVSVERLGDNVYFWIGDGPDTLLLNSHLDVVPPSENHPHDPFEPVETGGQLYGRGTVDAKASGAAMTTALLRLATRGWHPPGGRLLVALTTCEETGGAENGLERLLPHLPTPSAALVGEPTSLQPCVAQKGLLILKVQARGRSAHAARAARGDNAILHAAKDLRRLKQASFPREDPHLGAVTLTPTMIEGGTASNVVPDRCRFTLDVRTTPVYTHEEIIAHLRGLLDSEIAVHSDRIIPVRTPLSARIVRACREALPDAAPFGSPTASDWIFLRDIPTVKIGPGQSRYSHTPDEHIGLHEVRRAADAYYDIIQTYFQ